MSDGELSFIWFGGSWYAAGSQLPDTVVDQITISRLLPDGSGDGGEITITWARNGGEVFVELSAYADAWGLLASAQVRQLLEYLHDLQPVTVAKAIAVLEELGFKDRTPRQRPAGR